MVMAVKRCLCFGSHTEKVSVLVLCISYLCASGTENVIGKCSYEIEIIYFQIKSQRVYNQNISIYPSQKNKLCLNLAKPIFCNFSDFNRDLTK